MRPLFLSLASPPTLSQTRHSPSWAILIVLVCHMLTVLFSGLALGGVWGVREGARRPLAVSNTRLRINSVLNSVTRRGTFIGNSAGVLGTFPHYSHFRHFLLSNFAASITALVYNGVNSTFDALRGKHDIFGSMAAGAVTGGLYKSTGMSYYHELALAF